MSQSSTAIKRGHEEDAAKHVGTMVDDKYDLCQLIAVGGVGAVYRARHRFTGRQVALKLLKDQFSHDRGMAERFLREAKAAAEIGHPCIIDVVDAGVDENVGVYVAFELLEGLDLAAALKDKTLSIAQILDVADAVLDALEAAHRAGVVHRDIKPPNIFLVGGGCAKSQVRVLDFGAAKRQQVAPDESLTVVGTVIGTPAYMSPEQASAMPVDPRTDIWSVGAVLFRAFADRAPFTAANSSLLLTCIIRDAAPSLDEFRPDLPPSLIAVVDKALQHSPDLRWQSADEMRHALRSARDDASLPITERKPQVAVPEAPLPRAAGVDLSTNETEVAKFPPFLARRTRKRWAALAGALLVCGGAAFLVYSALTSTASSKPSPTPGRAAAASVPTVSNAALEPPSAAPAPSVASESATTQPEASASVGTIAPPPAGPAQSGTNARRTPKTESTSTAKAHPRVVPIREYE